MPQCLHHCISGAFFRLGCAIDARPKAALSASCLCSLLCMLGLLWLDVIVDYETLWVPRTVESWDDKVVFERNFGKPDRRLVVLVTAPPAAVGGAANVLTLPRLRAAHGVHTTITSVDGYDRLCTRAFEGGPCTVSSILAAWDFAEPSGDVASMLGQQPVVDQRLRRPMVLSTVVGGTAAHATALQMVFLMRNTPETEGDVAEWERRVLELLHDRWKVRSDDGHGEQFPDDIDVHVMAERSFQDENDRAINKDFIIVGLAVTVMILYVTAVTGSNPPVRSRVLLGSSIVVCVGFSLGAGFGICGFLGVGFNQISQMCFFILFGVGVDDMFIILERFKACGGEDEKASAQRTKVAPHGEVRAESVGHDGREDTAAPRIAVALSEAGPSITLTTVTDVAAFALGSNIEVPCIRDFCKGTAACIFFVFVLQSTFFAALLVLDQRRMDAGRVDCCPCMLADPRHLEEKEAAAAAAADASTGASSSSSSSSSSNSQSGSSGGGGGGGGARAGGCMHRFIKEKFAPFLMKPVVKMAVVVAFILVACVAAQRLSQLHNHMGITEWMPKDSYLLDVFGVLDTAFVGGSVTVHFVFDLQAADFSEPGTRAALSAYREAVASLPLALPPVNFFLDEPSLCPDAESTAGCSDADVKAWLESSANAQWRPFVVVDDTGKMRYARLTAELAQSAEWDIESQVEMMDQARHAVAGGPLSGFAYSGNFLWWDRDKNMDQQILQNVGLMLATAFMILVLFLPIALAATVAVLVTMVLLDLAGLVMTLWGVDLNVVSLMEIIMAVGFAVDYSAHIAHGFATTDASLSRNEQATAALVALGPPVFQGGFSTMLAVCLIGFAKSKGFEVLFKMFAGLVGFGLLHGLVLLPVVLSLFPACLHFGNTSAGEEGSQAVAAGPESPETVVGPSEGAQGALKEP